MFTSRTLHNLPAVPIPAVPTPAVPIPAVLIQAVPIPAVPVAQTGGGDAIPNKVIKTNTGVVKGLDPR